LDGSTSRHRCGGAGLHIVNLQPALNLLEGRDIRVLRIIQVLEFLEVVDQVINDRFDIASRMEAKHVGRFLRADLVVPEILNVLDVQSDRRLQAFLDGATYQVRDFADRVIAGRGIKYAGDLLVGLDGARVGCGGIFNAEERAPD